MNITNQKIIPFLMFTGRAEEAMNFYISLFDRSEIISIRRYGPGEGGAEGTVQHAAFSLNGQIFMAIDSSIQHEFTFTPAISLFVVCETEDELDHLYEKLSQGGMIYMPLGAYPFSKKFGWVGDRFGVTWQLNLGEVFP